MASGKYSRQQEKRLPTFYVMITAVVFVAFCLIGAWVLNSPSDSSAPAENGSVPVGSNKVVSKGDKDANDNQTFEDSTGDLATEERAEETTQRQKDSSDLDAEEKAEEGKRKGKSAEQNEVDEVEGKDELSVKEEDAEKSKADSEAFSEKPEKEPEPESNGAAQSEIQIENKETSGSFATQKTESKEEIELEEKQAADDGDTTSDESSKVIKQKKQSEAPSWELCEFEGATDYIPCLDNTKAIKALHSTKHYEHRERHCPETPPTCLVPLPEGYRSPIPWPKSRQEVWYSNVPHPGLVSYKKDQNWVKKSGDRLLFPGGGTQFKHGAPHYIDFIEQTYPAIAWGKHSRVVLDVGCGVASFGGFMFDKDVLTMSFAPKDEHEAQVQLALERGIPAISAVMGTQRLVFPSNVYDILHCARCRVPWHIEGGKLLLELNRVLRPGGYFVWSATPVYWKLEEDVAIWKEMVTLTAAMCWKLVAKAIDSSTGIGIAVFQKPTTNSCYENREKDFPPICDPDDKPDAAWYVPMTACIHKLPSDENARGTEWPLEWPERVKTAPTWLEGQKGVYGKAAPADFQSDYEHWQRVVQKSYISGLGIDWKKIRNVMDMRAVYGGFAAALKPRPVWVMNVVEFDSADTLPIIFDRGLFGMYHDWCESFSSYPRTYDLLHADHLFSRLKKRCNITGVAVEMDRLLRPEGWAIIRDKADVIEEVQGLLESLNWEIRMTFAKGKEALLAAQKTRWRPEALS